MSNEAWHAYTDGTDTIIGTSVEEAVLAYMKEVGLLPGDIKASDFKQLDDDKEFTITYVDEPRKPKTTKKVSEWIAERVAESASDESFSRLLGSTEY